MKNIVIVVLFFVLPLLCSCSSDEVKISENYIEKFEISDISPIEIYIKNDQFLIYVWTPQSEYEKLKSEEPIIGVSEGASYTKNGESWVAGYTVTAENGNIRNYSVTIDTLVPRMYSFDGWEKSQGDAIYYIPSSLKWSSGNEGIALAYALLPTKDHKDPESFPTRKTTEGYKGNAVLMETIVGGEVFGENRRLFSGNFFMGNFKVLKAIEDALSAIEIGYIYPAKLKTVKGYYKYIEGPGKFINKDGQEENRPDSCSMLVNFYQSDLPNGKDTTLTIRNIDDANDLVIARSRWHDCTATDGKFKEFQIKLENYTRETDFENHRYKLAISFAASKDGDFYSGKIGSKLIIDEMEFIDY
jgi:hypothetical protein